VPIHQAPLPRKVRGRIIEGLSEISEQMQGSVVFPSASCDSVELHTSQSEGGPPSALQPINPSMIKRQRLHAAIALSGSLPIESFVKGTMVGAQGIEPWTSPV
jgi:hypothetical protein